MPLHVLHWLSRWQLQRKRLDKSAVRLQLMVIYLFFIYLKLSSKGPNQQATNSFSDDACPKFKLLSITTGFSRASTFLRKRCKFDQLRENCISLHSVAAWCGVWTSHLSHFVFMSSTKEQSGHFWDPLMSLGRLLRVDLMTLVGLKNVRTSVHTSVRPQKVSQFRWNLVYR